MSKQPNRAEEPTQPPTTSPAVLVLGDIADTTWRLFVPTVGGTVIGLLLDRSWHTTPLLLIAGMALGVWLAVLLVRRQLKKVKQLS